MAIELVTFGGLHILDDEGELDWLAGQRSRAALLVYLSVEQRVSRESLMTVFWPESDTENARHALRQSLYQLKKAVRAEWVESLAHELVTTPDVRVDVHEFSSAIERGDLESAVRLYRGPFLDGVHLVDSSAWESWVDSRRAQYARAFRKAARELVESRLSSGDARSAISVAEKWVAGDPLDDEAQHRLIETLAAAGERTEAIRQFETYARAMGAEGLSPSPETAAFVDRLRSTSTPLPAFEIGSSPDLRRRKFPLITVAAAILAAVGLVSAWWLSRSRNETNHGSNAIAVLPFSIHGDQSVAYLREGMVTLLTAALDGAGSMRPIDARATFAAVNPGESASKTAERLSAGMYLLGDVTQAGGKLQIDAAVYRHGSREPSARAVVSGEKDSVFALADKLAAQLLGEMSDPLADRLVRTASVTTLSLPAFKEYLEGDRLMRAGQFERAADSYLTAIALDSTFAVAYYRLGLAREWAPLPGEDRAAAQSAHFASRLSPRDRNLLEAFRLWRSGRAKEAEQSYHAILTRYPEDVDAWFQLGEIQFHHAPLRGHSIRESESTWRKVLSFEPNNLFAVTHLARIAALDDRAAFMDSLLARYSPAQLRTDRRLIELATLRAVARGDRTTSAELTDEISKWEGLSAWRVAVFLTAFGGKPGEMRAVVPALINPAANPSLRADVLWFASLLELGSGRLSESQRLVSESAEAEERNTADKRRSALKAVTEWSQATLPLPYSDSTLKEMYDAASGALLTPSTKTFFNHDTELGRTIQLEPLRYYTLGITALRVGDSATALAAAGRLKQLSVDSRSTSLTRDLNRGLRAHIAWQRRDHKLALRILDSLELEDVQGDIAATPFAARANERFLHGEILSSTGRDSAALAYFASLGDGSVSEIPLRAMSHFRQGQLNERLHKPKEAAAHYARVVRLWSNADAQFQPVVQTARQRLSVLK